MYPPPPGPRGSLVFDAKARAATGGRVWEALLAGQRQEAVKKRLGWLGHSRRFLSTPDVCHMVQLNHMNFGENLSPKKQNAQNVPRNFPSGAPVHAAWVLRAADGFTLPESDFFNAKNTQCIP